MIKLLKNGLYIFNVATELISILIITGIVLMITTPILVIALFLGIIKKLTGLEV